MSTTTPVRVTSVRAELRTDSTVVGTPTPRLSWKSASTTRDWIQASAELELVGRETATIAGRDSVLVAWPFAPLAARETVELRVRVTGTDGSVSEWSEPQPITAGFLTDGEWTAAMVGAATPPNPAKPALVRTQFEARAGLVRATLYATAHGAYQVELNGSPVDAEILKPGWTSYQWHLVHETTDVTALVEVGANAIGVSLAGAWYTEQFGFREGASGFYGDDPAVAAQLVLEYADGSSETIATDGAWRATTDGPITASGIYQGEHYDARLEQHGWSSVGFDDSSWAPVRVDGDFPVPRARTAPAVRAIEELAVREVITTPAGKTVLDFGQNLVGVLRITVSGDAGHTVTLRHAEVLEHGELGIRPLRAAAATDSYTLAGTGDESWQPAFTFHGFRYAEIENWPGELDPSSITAVVIHSDMQRTGWFESSHELINRLHENVVWGMRGNFLYLPTDCPQRDERLGWTGDIQVFSPTASFLYEADGFLSGWLEDLALEQKAASGVVPFVVPNVLGDGAAPAAAWGDAATVVPTVLFERFANLDVVRAQYPSMVAWTDTLLAIAGDSHRWTDRFQFGDWLDPDAPSDRPAAAKTDTDIVATGYLYRSADFTARAAALLGDDAEAAKYRAIADRVKQAFLDEYVTPNGRMMSDAQTGYAMAIMFEMTRSEAETQAMGDRLADLVRSAGYRIGTGFVGTPLITDALTRTGHFHEATRLLTQTENPSWLYPVTMGATTIWERWDSMLEDGSINPGEMTSFNHYALGAVADWLHRSVAGLAPAAPGYRVIRFAPNPLDGFDHASATLDTPYGVATSGWRRDGDTVTISITVPANATGEVVVPGASGIIEVGSGEHEFAATVPLAPAPTGPVGFDTSLSAIMDDPEAYETVWKVVATWSEDAARGFRKNTEWTEGRVLREPMFQFPPFVQVQIGEALDELNARRG